MIDKNHIPQTYTNLYKQYKTKWLLLHFPQNSLHIRCNTKHFLVLMYRHDTSYHWSHHTVSPVVYWSSRTITASRTQTILIGTSRQTLTHCTRLFYPRKKNRTQSCTNKRKNRYMTTRVRHVNKWQRVSNCVYSKPWAILQYHDWYEKSCCLFGMYWSNKILTMRTKKVFYPCRMTTTQYTQRVSCLTCKKRPYSRIVVPHYVICRLQYS